MPIPKGITLADVHDAVARLDASEPHPFGPPTGYLAFIGGEPYPPKALVGLAARRLLGRDLTPGEFSSGTAAAQAVGVLSKLGVEIRPIARAAAAPAAWIFQGNPDRFDLDGYLNATHSILWLVKQHAAEVAEGQTVYLWRNRGDSGAVAGVVAVGVISGPPVEQPDHPAAVPFWKDPAEANTPALRVPIELIDVATTKRVIKAQWLQEDPVCGDLPNLRMRQGTNYPLQAPHAERLARLWAKTGQDFDRADLLLALRAYAQTYGGAVSVLAGSPVAQTALLTGRAVTSIYSKVMNLRSLDPRVEGAGQANGGAPTAAVWAEFWTGSEIDLGRLDAAVESLLTPGATPDTLKQLEAEAVEAAPDYSPEGRRRLVTHLRIERNRQLVADAKARWFNSDPTLPCCVCGMSFVKAYGAVGEGYIEAHHLQPLAALDEPKPPTVDDLAPVCANCHRMLHRDGTLSIEALAALAAHRAAPLREIVES